MGAEILGEEVLVLLEKISLNSAENGQIESLKRFSPSFMSRDIGMSMPMNSGKIGPER